MSWYKIHASDGDGKGRTWVGWSEDSPVTLANRAARGEFIRLDELLHVEGDEVTEWAAHDRAVVPTVFINAARITSFMQYREDPRAKSNE